MKNRINKKHMENGVILIDPSNTYINCDVKIGKDTVIYPNNVIEGKKLLLKITVQYIQDAELKIV